METTAIKENVTPRYRVVPELTREFSLLPEFADADRVFLLTDSGVAQHYLPRTHTDALPATVSMMTVPAGEASKTLDTASKIWEWLTQEGATRHSVLLNVGGGMVTDLGGFCAATFKRGMRFVNVSTTLLGAVDASIGGKTGVDFLNFKNQVGVFAEPSVTYVPVDAFSTLPSGEFLSGYAEMLKTAFISSSALLARLYELSPLSGAPLPLAEAIEECLKVKAAIVAADPTEKGLRKVLNFGHTAGHAYETLLLSRGTPVPHGVAVAHGLLPALILSHLHKGLDSMTVQTYARFLARTYPPLPVSCSDRGELLRLMAADKKNLGDGRISFTLLRAIGEPETDCLLTPAEVDEALDLRAELLGL